MQTLHLTNQPLRPYILTFKILAVGAFLGAIYLSNFLPSWTQAALLILFVGTLLLCSYLLIKKSVIEYTLTATHFQQHLFKGGWVLQWSNISRIDVVHVNNQGWQQPLPWVGIRIKEYGPYLQHICPRLIAGILMDQRSLLYLGMREMHQQSLQTQSALKKKTFEDIVLDATPYIDEHGCTYMGLQALMANRMHYQRQALGYDLFIAAADLDRSIDDFVGLTRRYLASVTSAPQTDISRNDDS